MSAVTTGFTRRLFHEFFPPPKFLEMPAVGLDISDAAVSAVELKRRKETYAVGRFGRRELPPEAIVGGYVHDIGAVIAELRHLKEELNIEFAHASFSEEKAYLFTTVIPRVGRKEIRGVLEFKLEENAPIPPSEAVFDYAFIAPTGRDAGERLHVGVTVLPKKVADTYTELLKAAGIMPLSLDVEAQAIARAVIGTGDRGTYLVVMLRERATGLSIVSDGVVQFASTAGVGGVHITQAIAQHLSVSAADAAALKREPAAFTDRKNANIFPSLVNVLSALKDEIEKLFMYWRTHADAAGNAQQSIRKIILCGRDAGIPGVADYLSLALQIPAEVGNVWRNVCSLDKYIPPILYEDSLEYAAAVGLALPKGH